MPGVIGAGSLIRNVRRMQPSRDIRGCLWIVRRWYFSFPAFGVLYGVIYLLARRGAELSPAQVLGFLCMMAALATAFFGALMLLVDLVLRIVRRSRK